MLDYEIIAPGADRNNSFYWKWEVFKCETGALVVHGGATDEATAIARANKEIARITAAIRQPIHYDIIDTHTGSVVARCKTRRTASNSVDKRDFTYGAIRFRAQPIYGPEA